MYASDFRMAYVLLLIKHHLASVCYLVVFYIWDASNNIFIVHFFKSLLLVIQSSYSMHTEMTMTALCFFHIKKIVLILFWFDKITILCILCANLVLSSIAIFQSMSLALTFWDFMLLVDYSSLDRNISMTNIKLSSFISDFTVLWKGNNMRTP